MTMSVSLIKVGNSNAFIIPAKVLRQLNVKDNTTFELSLEDNSTIQIRKKESLEKLSFPHIDFPEISKAEMNSFMGDLMSISKEEIESDERLAYILNK